MSGTGPIVDVWVDGRRVSVDVARELSRWGFGTAVTGVALARALAGPPELREAAVYLFERLSRPRARQAAAQLRAVLKAPSEAVRAAAARLLCTTAGERGAASLSEVADALGDSVPQVRLWALFELEGHGVGAAAFRLLARSFRDDDPRVCRAAGRLAARVPEDTFRELESALSDGERPLRHLSELLSGMGPGASQGVPVYRRLLAAADPEVRVKAAAALGSIEAPLTPARAMAVAILADMHKAPGDLRVLFGEDEIGSLIENLQHPEPSARIWAVAGLVWLGAASRAKGKLARALDDPDADVRRMAAEALGRRIDPP